MNLVQKYCVPIYFPTSLINNATRTVSRYKYIHIVRIRYSHRSKYKMYFYKRFSTPYTVSKRWSYFR